MMRPAGEKQSGFAMVEVVISIALMGILAVALLGALGAALNYFTLTDERETAKNFAELKMEEIQQAAFADDYLTIQNAAKPDEYGNYGVIINADPVTSVSDNVQMQKVTVTITRNSRTYLLEDYKVDR